MDNTEKVVNGFRFLPPSLGAWIGKDIPAQPYSGNIPWTAHGTAGGTFFYGKGG